MAAPAEIFNLKDIGLDITINDTTDIDDIEVDIDDIIEKWQKNPINNISIDATTINGKIHKTITINGKKYDLIYILKKGTYGTIYKMRHGGIDYALKVQEINPKMNEIKLTNAEHMKEIYNAFYEAIVNYILQIKFPEDVTHIHYFTFSNLDFYSVLEFIDGKTIHESIREKTINHDSRMLLLEEPLKRICNILNRIQDPLKFTHGDLHGNNAMVLNSDPTKIKLIDFGFSRVELPKCTITGNYYFNKRFHKGKDITILLYALMHTYEEGHLVGANAKKLFALYNNFLNKYKVYDDTATLYKDLDKDDNLDAHPVKVLEQIEANMKGGAFDSRKIGGRRTRMPRASRRKTRRRHSSLKSHMRNNTTRKNRMLPTIETLRLEMNPEDTIHENYSKYTLPVLENILLQSTIPHIQKYTNMIANLYLKEKDTSLQLDLFKTLLYFDSSVQAGAFEYFCETYKNASHKERIFMLYGTDPSIKGEHFAHIHWNTKMWL